MTLETALICIFAAAALFSLVALYYVMLSQINDARTQIQKEQDKRIDLEKRFAQLEHANNYRMSFVSTREIENALGEGAVAEQYALDLVDIIRNMKVHLSKAHTPPPPVNGKQHDKTEY